MAGRYDTMKYCDFVRDPLAMDSKLAKTLGFKELITPKSVAIISEPARVGQGNQKIILEGKGHYLMKNLSDPRVIAIIISDLEIDRNMIEYARHNDKILIINAAQITTTSENYRSRAISRARELVRNALHYKIKIALCTTAKDPSEILSLQQMLEIAKLLGASEEDAKKMCSNMADAI